MASPSVARTRRAPSTIDSDDALAMRAAEVGEWARRNARRILTVAAVAGVVLLAALAYFFWQQSNEAKASAEYLRVSSAAAPGTQRTAQLEGFVARYGGTTEGQEARLELAGLYLDANQPQKALPHARSVADASGDLKYQGQLMLGAVLARTNDRAGAVQAYRDAAGTTKLKFQRAEALNQAALLQEGAGNWQGAADLYREILKDTEEGSVDRSVIEMRLAEAEGHLAAGAR